MDTSAVARHTTIFGHDTGSDLWKIKLIQTFSVCIAALESEYDCCKFGSRSRRAILVTVVDLASLHDMLWSTWLVLQSGET